MQNPNSSRPGTPTIWPHLVHFCNMIKTKSIYLQVIVQSRVVLVTKRHHCHTSCKWTAFAFLDTVSSQMTNVYQVKLFSYIGLLLVCFLSDSLTAHWTVNGSFNESIIEQKWVVTVIRRAVKGNLMYICIVYFTLAYLLISYKLTTLRKITGRFLRSVCIWREIADSKRETVFLVFAAVTVKDVVTP